MREREKKKKTYDLVFKSKHIKHTHTKKEKDICGLQRRVSTVSKNKKKKDGRHDKKKKKKAIRVIYKLRVVEIKKKKKKEKQE